jgi:hypothetical protein
MALKQNIETRYGFVVSEAYIRIESANVAKDKVTFTVCSYADKEKPFFDSKVFSCAYDISGSNPIKQAYVHLKTLPEFTGAVDC